MVQTRRQKKLKKRRLFREIIKALGTDLLPGDGRGCVGSQMIARALAEIAIASLGDKVLRRLGTWEESHSVTIGSTSIDMHIYPSVNGAGLVIDVGLNGGDGTLCYVKSEDFDLTVETERARFQAYRCLVNMVLLEDGELNSDSSRRVGPFLALSNKSDLVLWRKLQCQWSEVCP